MSINKKMLEFFNASPTAFHAIDEIVKVLKADGFVELPEHEKWNIEINGKYYVTRNHSSIIAFKMPADISDSGFHMVASHSDSPTFKLKPNSIMVVEDTYVKLNTEIYGGPIMNTWMDRPLSIAGRVMVKTVNGIEERLINFDEDLCLIPNMAIHQNRTANDGMKYNAQIDMLPIIGFGNNRGVLIDKIAKEISVNEEDIMGSDLYLYNRQPGIIWGDGQYLSSARIDNLQCAYASLISFVRATTAKNINVYCCFDNEEVGSTTRQGANSTLLDDVLYRITECFGISDKYHEMIAKSFLISADNAHSVHPNHPELADQTNRVHINGGVVIKYNANQSYTSDSFSAALFAQCCKEADVPVQYFTNRSDVRGGGTLGNISTAHVSVPSVDIGLAQWAMHSSYETAGCQDTEMMIRALAVYYEKDFRLTSNGVEW
jgi:Aspartyl aminopeptidase